MLHSNTCGGENKTRKRGSAILGSVTESLEKALEKEILELLDKLEEWEESLCSWSRGGA